MVLFSLQVVVVNIFDVITTTYLNSFHLVSHFTSRELIIQNDRGIGSGPITVVFYSWSLEGKTIFNTHLKNELFKKFFKYAIYKIKERLINP